MVTNMDPWIHGSATGAAARAATVCPYPVIIRGGALYVHDKVNTVAAVAPVATVPHERFPFFC